MRFWQLAIISIIIAGVTGYGKAARRDSQFAAEDDTDARIVALANEVHSKGWIIYSACRATWTCF
jgi:hypothetical protein